jgi:opacity protein-like surface antigen
MRLFLLVVFALAALARPAAAQLVDEDSVVEYDRSFYAEISAPYPGGTGIYLAGNLQNLLAAQGYTKFSNSVHETFTSGIYSRWGRIKVGLAFGFNPPLNRQSNNAAFRSQRQFTVLRLGYSVLNTRNRRFFVNLGFGAFEWEEQVLNTNPAGQGVVTWASLRGRNLPSQTGFLLRNQQGVLDVGIELQIRERKRRDARFNYRVGYTWGLNPQAWQALGLTLTDAPVDRLQRIYLEANIALIHSRNKR